MGFSGRRRALAAVISCLTLAGCSNDEASPVAPAGTTDAQTAALAGLFALDATDQLLLEVANVAGGDLTGLSVLRAAPVWDAELRRWRIDVAESNDGGSYAATHTVQYLAGGEVIGGASPPTDASSSDELLFSTMATNHRVFDRNGNHYEETHSFVGQLHVTHPVDDVFLVRGAGDMDTEARGVRNDRPIDESFSAEWSSDLIVPGAGCASGEISLSVSGFRLDAAFDGVGRYRWSLWDGTKLVFWDEYRSRCE